MWSIESLSAERYRPLLTAQKRRDLLEGPDSLSRKERQRLRQIALAGIYDLTFLLGELPDDDVRKVFSDARPPAEDPKEDHRIGNYHQKKSDPDWWTPTTNIEYVDGFRDRLLAVDDSDQWEAQETVLNILSMDPKLAETDMETRSELLKPIIPYERLRFTDWIGRLISIINDGFRRNGLDLESGMRQFRQNNLDMQDSNTSSVDQSGDLAAFKSDLEDLAIDGSLIVEIG